MILNDRAFSSFIKKVNFCQREDYLMKNILQTKSGGKVEKK